MTDRIDIVPFSSIAGDGQAVRALRNIFFDTSGKMFDDDSQRQAFAELWLEQFLRHDPELAHVAMSYDQVVGYIVASHVDPAQSPRFSELGYFRDFAEFTVQFPAQLHVNLNEAWRGMGIGGKLVRRVCADASAAGLNGVHVVTAAQARNRAFYERQGFSELALTGWKGNQVVFLARTCNSD